MQLPGFYLPSLLESASESPSPSKNESLGLCLACCSVPCDFVFVACQCWLASFAGFQRFPSVFVFGIKPAFSHPVSLSSGHTAAASSLRSPWRSSGICSRCQEVTLLSYVSCIPFASSLPTGVISRVLPVHSFASCD